MTLRHLCLALRHLGAGQASRHRPRRSSLRDLPHRPFFPEPLSPRPPVGTSVILRANINDSAYVPLAVAMRRRLAVLGLVRLGGVLALFAGFLIATGGFSSHSFLLDLVALAKGEIPALLSGAPGALAQTALFLLALIISLGGITVMVGGVALLYRHSTAGRLLIALGGGAGFIGLIFGVGYSLITQGLSSLSLHVYYWLGVLLAAIARWLAK